LSHAPVNKYREKEVVIGYESWKNQLVCHFRKHWSMHNIFKQHVKGMDSKNGNISLSHITGQVSWSSRKNYVYSFIKISSDSS
jgi:hypothetical protein